MTDLLISLREEASSGAFFHAREDNLRQRISCMESSKQEHYLFLQAASKTRKRCLHYWLQKDADLTRGTANHPEWIALNWARSSNANPEVLRLLTLQDWPRYLPGPFCVASRTGHLRARVQLRPQEREHHLFLARGRKSLQSMCTSLAGARRGQAPGHFVGSVKDCV